MARRGGSKSSEGTRPGKRGAGRSLGEMAYAPTRTELYCLVPRHLADAVLDPLRDHFAPQGIAVIIEKRDKKQKVSFDIRKQRAMHIPRSITEELPAEVEDHRDDVKLVQRMGPAGVELADTHLLVVISKVLDGDGMASSELIWRVNARVLARLDRLHGEAFAARHIEAALGRILDNLGGFDGEDETEFLHWVDRVVDDGLAFR